MKHLIETTDLSSLGNAKYDRLILDSTKNEIVYMGGVKYEYVDLGLRSGLKWAKCNLGAEKETDYGYYFQWGSTKANTPNECTWSNAPFNNKSDSYNEEYFNKHKSKWLDDNNNLKPEYDAASHIMGGDWRMPTKAELQELIDYTTNEWITNYNGTVVNGRKFTGLNGNSIFIPAAGICVDGEVYDVYDYGYVWSSSLFTSWPKNAWYLGLGSDNCNMNDYFRYNGRSVSGVRK